LAKKSLNPKAKINAKLGFVMFSSKISSHKKPKIIIKTGFTLKNCQRYSLAHKKTVYSIVSEPGLDPGSIGSRKAKMYCRVMNPGCLLKS
jgi:hypothetical protein